MLFLCALVIAVAGASGRVSSEGDDGQTRQRVEHLLVDWRAGKIKSPDDLSQALSALGNDASPILCQALDQRTPELPVDPIARAVGRLGSLRSLACLGRLSQAKVPADRVSAVEALRLLKREQGLEFMVGVLDDEDADVVASAESALLTVELPIARVAQAIADKLPLAKEKNRLARLLARLECEEAHTALIDGLTALDADTRLAALEGLWILARPGDGEAVAALLHNGSSVGIQKQACLFLGRVHCWSAVRDLIDCLKDEDAGIASNAHWALQQITGLKLKPEAELWESWWERLGKKLVHRNTKGDQQ